MHLSETLCRKGFILVAHEPGSVSGAPGSHIRGSMVRASEAGDEEVDLVLTWHREVCKSLSIFITFLLFSLDGN
jgi:hypothetical protein